MVRCSEETGKLFMVSQSRRWDARHERLRQTIADTLGKILLSAKVHVDDTQGKAHFVYDLTAPPAPISTPMKSTVRIWFRDLVSVVLVIILLR